MIVAGTASARALARMARRAGRGWDIDAPGAPVSERVDAVVPATAGGASVALLLERHGLGDGGGDADVQLLILVSGEADDQRGGAIGARNGAAIGRAAEDGAVE